MVKYMEYQHPHPNICNHECCVFFQRHRIPKKMPSDYTRKGDGEKIKRGELHKEVPKAEPPVAGAFKLRDNPPNTLVIFLISLLRPTPFE